MIKSRRPLFTSLLLFSTGLLVYGVLAGRRLFWQTPNEYVALAQALLSGRLDITPDLAPYLDLAAFGGRFFVPYPPAPALIYAPAVALWGLGAYPGLLHLALAAAVLPLFYLVLRRYTSDTGHSEGERLWLVALLAFGTVFVPLAVDSKVYFGGQVVALFFTCLYLLAAFQGRHGGWAGLTLGLAFLARGPLLLAFPLALSEMTRAAGAGTSSATVEVTRKPWKQRYPALLPFLLALGLVLLLAAAYNWARFGSPVEFGYRYLAWDDRATIDRYGLFHPAYLERNLHAALTALPVVLPQFPYLVPHPEGLSLLLATPALALLVRVRRWTGRARRPLMVAGLVALPSLLYANTGFVQYGYRYAADFLPFVILSMPLAGLRFNSWRVKALIVAGIAVCLWMGYLAGRHPFTPEMLAWIQEQTLLRYR